MVLMSAVGAGLMLSRGMPTRSWIHQFPIFNKTYPNWLAKRLQGLSKDCKIDSRAICRLQKGRRNALVIGNSHVVDGWNIIRTIYPKDYFFVLDTNGCRTNADMKNDGRCTDPTNLRFNADFLRQFDYIIYSKMLNPNSIDESNTYLAFLKTNRVDKVVILGNYYRSALSFDDAFQMYGQDEPILRKFMTIDPFVNEALTATAAATGYLFVDKFATLCEKNICPLFTPEGVPFTYDNHHLTRAFAIFFSNRSAPQIIRYLGAP